VLGEYAGKGGDEVSDPLAAISACTVIPARSSEALAAAAADRLAAEASVEISAKTRLLTVIGDPVAHSLSPAMQNAACRALGLDAVYIALQVPPASLPAVLAMQAAIGGAGNVTVPHKEAVERFRRAENGCLRPRRRVQYVLDGGCGLVATTPTYSRGCCARPDRRGATRGTSGSW